MTTPVGPCPHDRRYSKPEDAEKWLAWEASYTSATSARIVVQRGVTLTVEVSTRDALDGVSWSVATTSEELDVLRELAREYLTP